MNDMGALGMHWRMSDVGRANQDCDGRIEAHHILGWAEHVELRYEVNNGITLCHFHHPRTRVNEERYVPAFQELVAAKMQ